MNRKLTSQAAVQWMAVGRKLWPFAPSFFRAKFNTVSGGALNSTQSSLVLCWLLTLVYVPAFACHIVTGRVSILLRRLTAKQFSSWLLPQGLLLLLRRLRVCATPASWTSTVNHAPRPRAWLFTGHRPHAISISKHRMRNAGSCLLPLIGLMSRSHCVRPRYCGLAHYDAWIMFFVDNWHASCLSCVLNCFVFDNCWRQVLDLRLLQLSDWDTYLTECSSASALCGCVWPCCLYSDLRGCDAGGAKSFFTGLHLSLAIVYL